MLIRDYIYMVEEEGTFSKTKVIGMLQGIIKDINEGIYEISFSIYESIYKIGDFAEGTLSSEELKGFLKNVIKDMQHQKRKKPRRKRPSYETIIRIAKRIEIDVEEEDEI